MFNKVTIDLLFNLLLSFVVLFFLSFIMVNEKAKEENKNTQSKSQILVTMYWDDNVDMDLWLRLPSGESVGYSKRHTPPAHLDIDVIKWREYNGQVFKENQEIISIQGVVYGEYTVNVHYFDARDLWKGDTPVSVKILVQDVRNRRVIYFGEKEITDPRSETHFVKFSVSPNEFRSYSVKDVYTDRPEYFVGQQQ